MQFLHQFRSSFEKIFIVLLLLVVFLLPLDRRVIPSLIALACAAWILHGNLPHKLAMVYKSPGFILPVIFYLLYLTGMLYTENVKTGLSHLEVKFSLLLFPIVLPGMRDVLMKNFRKIAWAFVFGNLTASVICLVYAAYRLIATGENYFFYSDFSIFNLPTYSSVYVLFSMAILFYFITEESFQYTFKIKLLCVAGILFFACIVFLNYSRAALVSGIVAFAFTAAFYFVKRKKWFWLFTCIILPALVTAGLFKYHPRFEPIRRFVAMPLDSLPPSSGDNIAIRYMVAKQSVKLVKENFWLGTGTGDVKDELMKKYSSLNMVAAEHERLNAHNQFMETFIGLGIIGFLVLVLMVFEPLYSGMRENNILKIAFAILIAINFLFESMLNTEAGVIFYAFFTVLLATVFLPTEKKISY
jgi:O-antigen ligase